MARGEKAAYYLPQMPGMDRPVLILSDHVAMKVRLRDAMAPYARVECVVSEHELLQRAARPARLIIIHGVPPFSDARLPARLRRALGEMAASIVVVTHPREPAWQLGRALIASGQVEDIIYTDTERVECGSVVIGVGGSPRNRGNRGVAEPIAAEQISRDP
jgi:hypothetical protein